MPNARKATLQELKFIELLLKKSTVAMQSAWKEKLLVRDMNDGKMGGLKLFPSGNSNISLKQIAHFAGEVLFKDTDGVDVLATLYVDQNNDLFELDMWKTDFNKLHKLPLFDTE